MKPKGQDVADSVRDWLKTEISGASSVRLDLGKFFFAVTSGTAGVFISIEKLSGTPKLEWSLGLALLTLLVALLISLAMAIPKFWKIEGNTDIIKLYNDHIRKNFFFIIIWFGFWIVGTIIGIFALVSN